MEGVANEHKHMEGEEAKVEDAFAYEPFVAALFTR